MIIIGGWIKLYRELLKKAIWKKSTSEQKNVLIAIMLLANHRENEWEWQGKRFAVQPGQFITSLPSLAEAADCSIQNVRSALVKFKKYEFLTDQSTVMGRLISIINWDIYQGEDDEPNRQPSRHPTDTQQTTNRLPTANKNDKKDKKDKKINTPPTPQGGSEEDDADLKRGIWEKYSFSPAMSAIIKSWGKYKTERREKYKPQGFNSLLSQINKHVSKHGESAVIELIEMCMANNWAGIAFDKLDKSSSPCGKGKVSNATDRSNQAGFKPEGMAGFHNAADDFDDDGNRIKR